MSKIKIMSWNIWSESDPHEIADFIKTQNADIICCQELVKTKDLDAVKVIADATDYYAHDSLTPQLTVDGREVLMGCGIFSRYPILSRLVKPITVEGHGNIRDYIEASIDVASQKVIKVGTAHLYFAPNLTDTERRLAQLQMLVNFIKGHKKYFVLAGDFNAHPNTKIIKTIDSKLKNAGPDFGHPTWTTKPFSYVGFNEDKLKWRIDYIFTTKDIKSQRSEILKTNLSDHLPVLVEIDL